MNGWDLHLNDWLNLLVRWIHLIAGISWIGSSFYFMWLDAHLTPPDASKKDVEGELWMVHSGGFYLVERKKINSGNMPKTLHWFKYEALFTWLSGIGLLGIIYYLTQGAYLVDPSVRQIDPGLATAFSIGMLILSWVVYDLLWQSRLGDKSPNIATGISILLATAAGFGFCHFLSGRAAFIHVGAMFGTIMVANVWFRILPAQQKMVDATRVGQKPDYSLSDRAKRRSVHNSYMTFPVLFMMLSNHYANAYGHPQKGLVLFLLILLGGSIRHVMISKSENGKWAMVPALASLLAVVSITSAPPSPSSLVPPVSASHSHMESTGEHVSFREVKDVISKRCVYCHATHPTEKAFGPAPGGVHFETADRIKALAPRIKFRAVDTKTMPLANRTGITDSERALLGRWVEQGASIEE